MRTKHCVNYTFQAARTMAPRMVLLYAKAITRSMTNIAVNQTPWNETFLFQGVLLCKRHEYNDVTIYFLL